MAVAATQLQNYLKTWDTFRDIWEMDKDLFIKRYHRMNPTVAAFDSDIARSATRKPLLSENIPAVWWTIFSAIVIVGPITVNLLGFAIIGLLVNFSAPSALCYFCAVF